MIVLATTLTSCGRLSFEPPDSATRDAELDADRFDAGPRDAAARTDADPVDAGPGDAGVDGGPPDAGMDAGPPSGPFGPATRLAISHATASDLDVTLTADELEVFFVSNRNGSDQVLTATRARASDPFGAPVLVTALNTGQVSDPEVSEDGLRMRLTLSSGGAETLHLSTRASRTATWSAPTPITELAAAGANCCATSDRADLLLVFASDRGGRPAPDLFVSARTSTASPWGAPTPISELNTNLAEVNAQLREDGLAIVFDSNRPGGMGGRDLYLARRADVSLPFAAPDALSSVNTSSDDRDAWLSEDGRRLYFTSDRSGQFDLYVVSR